MKHLILGTAGHVDHGKTALIKALTGFDCDTHQEEKQRGITIHLGFTHLDLGDSESLGIVDVPGHRDFIHTMVGGSSGIDFALLVIAADSGIMPQTREHLNIMRILGVRHGIIAVTKIDLVEEDFLDLVNDEIGELVKGTFLEGAPLVGVSAKTGAGIDRLKDTIREMMRAMEERPTEGVFRMFVDRLFTVPGFGTVVTGSVISGKAQVGDNLFLLPGTDAGYRVRRLERHGNEVPTVVAGDRASINLVGLERSAFQRGLVLADRILRCSTMLDATLEVYEPGVTIGRWSQVMFHVGTYEQQARMHLLDRDSVTLGERALVQFHLPKPCVLQHGDRYVIQNSSEEWTLGGGTIIDVAPLHHRRRKEGVIQGLEKLAAGKLSEIIAQEVVKLHRATSATEVATNLNVTVEKVTDSLKMRIPRHIVRQEGKNGVLLYTREGMEALQKGIRRAIQAYRKGHPLAGRGANFDEIRGFLRIDRDTPGEELLRATLRHQTEKGRLKEKERTWLLTQDLDAIDETMRGHIAVIEGYIAACGMQVPLMSVMKELADQQGMSEKDLKQVLHHLTSTGIVYCLGEEFLHRAVVDVCREKLIMHLTETKGGMTVADFRDLTGGNRKSSLVLLAIFDHERIVRREGDLRFLAWRK
jgi:selenocysteine-specific elongation factor